MGSTPPGVASGTPALYPLFVVLCSFILFGLQQGATQAVAENLGRRLLSASSQPALEHAVYDLRRPANPFDEFRQQAYAAAYMARPQRALLQAEAQGEAVATGAATAAGGVPPGMRQVCLNICSKANNGICEDGRRPADPKTPNPVRMVYCDLGTDCADCGPWLTTAEKMPWEEPNVPGPIALLMSKDVQVRVRDSALAAPYSFGFAYTDPQKEFGVSSDMENAAMVEGSITMMFYKMFSGVCEGSPDGKRKLFVDVGANFGWYSVMAAKMGCRVIGFEPVPHFRALFTYSTYLNDLQGLTDIVTDVVNDNHGGTVRFVVPARGIWGTAGIDGANIDPAIESAKEELQLKSVSLDEVIKDEVLLLKVDVEGFEWAVMKGAAQLLKNGKIQNIIMEYSPGVPERMHNMQFLAATPAMLKDILDAGFRIGHIAWGSVPPEGVPEITKDNIKYDINDVNLLKQNKLGCPPAPEMAQFALWKGCGGALPEDVSPRSLRSEIGHNTNIWATRNTTILAFNGVVGVIKPHEPKETFFATTEKGQWGMGWRPCMHLDPVVQTRHRCKCTVPEKCGKEEEAAMAAAAAGNLATNYILP